MTDISFARSAEQAKNYVAGEWRDPAGEGEQDVVNSATGEPVGVTPFSDETGVNEAVAAADEAFEDWSALPVEERIQPLFELKNLLEANQDDLAETLAREHGKTLAEAKGELRRGIENVEVACGMPSMMQAGHLPNAAPDIDETAVRQPLGVFTAVTPFNFPGMIPLWFLPYAVATGNAFVLKPSERTPFTAMGILELVDAAGFPDGVVNLVHGGPDTVNALLAHDDVVGASFVGSTPVAEHVYETAAKHGKRVQAQGGAKNHIVVSDSANLEFAAEQTVSSAFANSGQRCLANPVAVVHDAVYDEFADRVVERAAALEVGDGLDEATEMGPLVTADHERTVREYVETGVEEGATLLLDGRERDSDLPDEGFYLAPTVFGDTDPEMTVAREEIFGPVLALIRAEDFDDALSILNRSEYGNAASLFTERGREAKRFRHEAEAGNLGVNIGTAAPMAFFHFGGRKDSFFGDLHAQGEDMIRFYTDETVYIERWPEE
ncbi:CoA-acylating methylmalonate-semialdehyde dehydrogenase [Halorussus limi]|uniref:methylmalonate-semialdehyde dehydrogenase (CoA acylating) n=1 Tax=Halorussus limi TaxID=2938695 RepID=A0A8U0HWE4_9EURY|nr:CoA-acylating methylmalonate-semialdehyde dehydrogenase [Halorussus limi]UPV75400.1 CoA-acylating methylmalonate-semialdehyde dehydrogenase [Halorussus limi]